MRQREPGGAGPSCLGRGWCAEGGGGGRGGGGGGDRTGINCRQGEKSRPSAGKKKCVVVNRHRREEELTDGRRKSIRKEKNGN
jgi:hypothetical protein